MRRAIYAVGFFLIVGCGDQATDKPDGGKGATITLSGKLVAGAQTPLPPSPVRAPGELLVGYQLYCVTFADPPSAATGTSDDAGQVSFAIGAAGVAMGCFVLDATGAGVAALIFTTGLEHGQTITLTGDTDLGSITVDLDNGVAMTDVIQMGALTGSDGFTCPLGSWEATISRQDCTGTATTRFWIVQNPEGEYLLNFTLEPVQLAGSGGQCGIVAHADIPVTESAGSFTLTFPGDPSCPAKTLTVTLTPNQGCTELAATSFFSGCSACNGQECECGGDLDCPLNPSTATRK
ncbi:MAG TPA: hypothetical protein VM425_00975 [Myxococcota bacterium]|nr:hypothetical protein [Myxococcota bacterium]